MQIWKTKPTQIILLVTLAGLLLMAACATVPITGRRQLSIIPDSQMNAMSRLSDLIDSPVSRLGHLFGSRSGRAPRRHEPDSRRAACPRQRGTGLQAM